MDTRFLLLLALQIVYLKPAAGSPLTEEELERINEILCNHHENQEDLERSIVPGISAANHDNAEEKRKRRDVEDLNHVEGSEEEDEEEGEERITWRFRDIVHTIDTLLRLSEDQGPASNLSRTASNARNIIHGYNSAGDNIADIRRLLNRNIGTMVRILEPLTRNIQQLTGVIQSLNQHH